MTAMQNRKEIERLESELKRARETLERQERSCAHQWSEIQPDHIRRESYVIEGDKIGTCGADWRAPIYVPSSKTYRWKRTCEKCGKIEHTSATENHVTEKPVFL